MALLGTGVGANYDSKELERLSSQVGKEVHLFRAVCDNEYISILNNNNKFTPYAFAMEMKWFATCHEHAKMWGELFYPDKAFKVVEITVSEKALCYMFYMRMLDNIGSAYAADIYLLNRIVKGVRLV